MHFERFFSALSLDFTTKTPDDEAHARQQTIADLQRRLRREGRTLSDFGFTETISDRLERALLGDEAAAETFRNCPTPDQLRPDDQAPTFDKIMAAVKASAERKPTQAGRSRLIRLTARAGAGKSFLINTILRAAYLRGYDVIAAASSGIAASSLAGGRTAHKALSLPVCIGDDDDDDELEIDVVEGTKLWKRYETLDAIIVDEAFMLDARYWQALSDALQKVASKSKSPDIRALSAVPFAGKLIVVIGDMKQLPPVVKYGGCVKLLCRVLKCLPFWDDAML